MSWKSGKKGGEREREPRWIVEKPIPSAIWTVERRSFWLKFWGSALLDKRNNSMMVDRDFNGQILKSVVGEPNPKTLIKYVFSLGKKL